jgi:transcriptional regulator of acetoin/glycerol metabolism
MNLLGPLGQISRPIKCLPPNRVSDAWEKFIETGEIDSGIVRKEIAESWKRCCGLYKLDPYAPKKPIRLFPNEISDLGHRNVLLVEASRPFLKLLEVAVGGSGFIITLADKDGYVLQVVGDEEILKMAEENNYLPGCRRTEDEVGTNAIGLALHERKPVQTTGAEHFNINHHQWTCSSSPIFSREKELLGAVTLSGKSIGVHQHTLGMAISAARAIENKMVEDQLSLERDGLSSYLDSLLDSISEGIIAVRKDGEVTHINGVAEKMLKIEDRSIIGEFLNSNSVMEIESPTWEEILGAHDISNQEMIAKAAGKWLGCILSTKPIVVKGREIGKILILSEKRKVYELIHQFTGGRARFTFDDIIGKNNEFLRQVKLAKMASKTDSRILLQGESGTGKELFAQAIHNQSKRSNGPFLALNCSAIPRELIEAELFGYREGAFTGARRGGQTGKFELACGGTLFLDDIDSMSFDMQAKILRVLQENEIIRLGDDRARKIDVRVIASTNKDLIDLVKKKDFREDLFFRITVVEIIIPPLRKRMDDLPDLVEHILKRISERVKSKCPRLSDEAFQRLSSFHWPGNVRELENYLERACLLCTDGTINVEHLPARLFIPPPSVARSLDHELRGIKEEEEILIKAMLRKCKGNISKTARNLKISRSTLHRRVKALNLHSDWISWRHI